MVRGFDEAVSRYVTNNKRTMAAADALYGVTQEEDGVSKIVSVRLKRDNFDLKKPAPEKVAVGAEATPVIGEE